MLFVLVNKIQDPEMMIAMTCLMYVASGNNGKWGYLYLEGIDTVSL